MRVKLFCLLSVLVLAGVAFAIPLGLIPPDNCGPGDIPLGADVFVDGWPLPVAKAEGITYPKMLVEFYGWDPLHAPPWLIEICTYSYVGDYFYKGGSVMAHRYNLVDEAGRFVILQMTKNPDGTIDLVFWRESSPGSMDFYPWQHARIGGPIY